MKPIFHPVLFLKYVYVKGRKERKSNLNILKLMWNLSVESVVKECLHLLLEMLRADYLIIWFI